MDEPPENETAAPVKKAAGSDEEAKSYSHGSRLVASENAVFIRVPRLLIESSTGRTLRNPSRTTSSRSPLGMTEWEIGLAGWMREGVVTTKAKQRQIGGGKWGPANLGRGAHFTSPAPQTMIPTPASLVRLHPYLLKAAGREDAR